MVLDVDEETVELESVPDNVLDCPLELIEDKLTSPRLVVVSGKVLVAF